MRFAIVRDERKRVEAYLPDNYSIVEEVDDLFVIGGEDNAGWTMDDYVLPRLASGLIFARELTETAADEDPDIEWEGSIGFTVFGGALITIMVTSANEFAVTGERVDVNRIPLNIRVWLRVISENRLVFNNSFIDRDDWYLTEPTDNQRRKISEFVQTRIYPFIPARAFNIGQQVAIGREIETIQIRIDRANIEIEQMKEEKRELELQLDASVKS